jgi:hypothetical protein
MNLSGFRIDNGRLWGKAAGEARQPIFKVLRLTLDALDLFAMLTLSFFSVFSVFP